MIFIVKDEHSMAKDATLARHVVGVHMAAAGTGSSASAMEMIEESMGNRGDLSSEVIEPEFLRSYIAFCRGYEFPL